MGGSLVGASLAAFVLSRDCRAARLAPAVLAACGAYGPMLLAAAVWAVSLVLRLAATLCRQHVLAPTPGRAADRLISPACREIPAEDA